MKVLSFIPDVDPFSPHNPKPCEKRGLIPKEGLIIEMALTSEQIAYFNECASGIIASQEFQQMSNYIQHGNTTCLQHSVAVAYYSYSMYIKMGGRSQQKSVIRGALLHDFFLYDWHIRGRRTGWKLHGFTHPRAAWENARKLFPMNRVEKDIILKHMWPLTIIPPKRKEALIVCLADKFCAMTETMSKHAQERFHGYAVPGMV